MPAKSGWLLRIPEILEELRILEDAPFLDRAVIEKLFGVRRRRAHQLMEQFRGYQIGRAYLVNRTQVMEVLEAMANGDAFQRESLRKTRLTEDLQKTRKQLAARRVAIPAATDVRDRHLAGLPEGIDLKPVRLTIDFSGPEDLLAKLFELSQAIANDFPKFQALLEKS